MKHSDSISLEALLKRSRRYWRNETAYSISLRKYSPEAKDYILEKGLHPVQVNSVINISIALERHFNLPKFKALKRGFKVYMKYGAKFDSYMDNWFKGRQKYLEPHRALEEQKARGFTRKVKPNPNYPYLCSLVDKRYIWPKQYNIKYANLGGIYEKAPLIGVSGFTAIKIPKTIIYK